MRDRLLSDKLVVMLATCAIGCSGAAGPVRPAADAARTLAHLTINGSPESQTGAAWTYRDTIDRVAYDLSGVLLKPPGAGPFPAIVLSHGYGGSTSPRSVMPIPNVLPRTATAWAAYAQIPRARARRPHGRHRNPGNAG